MTAKPDPEQSRKRIFDDHREIGSLLSQCTASEDASEVRDCLERLQVLFARHFKQEEDEIDGLPASIHRKTPRLEHSLQGIKEEHRQLLESVRVSIEHADKTQGNDPRLQEMCRTLRDRFASHEARETDIFVESIWTDIGAAD